MAHVAEAQPPRELTGRRQGPRTHWRHCSALMPPSAARTTPGCVFLPPPTELQKMLLCLRTGVLVGNPGQRNRWARSCPRPGHARPLRPSCPRLTSPQARALLGEGMEEEPFRCFLPTQDPLTDFTIKSYQKVRQRIHSLSSYICKNKHHTGMNVYKVSHENHFKMLTWPLFWSGFSVIHLHLLAGPRRYRIQIYV